jgi:hypothetical protein
LIWCPVNGLALLEFKIISRPRGARRKVSSSRFWLSWILNCFLRSLSFFSCPVTRINHDVRDPPKLDMTLCRIEVNYVHTERLWLVIINIPIYTPKKLIRNDADWYVLWMGEER